MTTTGGYMELPEGRKRRWNLSGAKHITVRACLAAALLGLLFTFITLRLTLGSAGMTPPLTIPAGLLSFVLLKMLTRLMPGAAALSAQENAVAQTIATSCYKIVGFAGYGSYLTALSYPIYLQLGGVPKGQPGYQADAVVDPDLHRIYPYLLCIAFGGIFVLLGLRVLLIIRWRLPFPSGAASGSMINSLHGCWVQQQHHHHQGPAQAAATAAAAGTAGSVGRGEVFTQPHPVSDTLLLQPAAGATASMAWGGAGSAINSRSSGGGGGGGSSSLAAERLENGVQRGVTMGGSSGGSNDTGQLAARQVRVLGYTALGSFLFDAFKWLFQGSGYGCGFAAWPTFGLTAAQWSWRFDFQQQYIGSGFLVPHIVSWSMLLGAVLAHGVMWPLLSRQEDEWYPSGLSPSDMRGLSGYKVFLSVALLLGEGAWVMLQAALLGLQHLRVHMRARWQLSLLLPSVPRQQHKMQRDDPTSSSSGSSRAGLNPESHWQSSDTHHQQQLQHLGADCSTQPPGSCNAPPAVLHSSCCKDTAVSYTSSSSSSGAGGGGGEVRLRLTASFEQQRQQGSRLGEHSHLHWRDQQQQQQRLQGGVNPDAVGGGVDHCQTAAAPPAAAAAAAAAGIHRRHGGGGGGGGGDGGGGIAGAVFKETAEERVVREAVFLSDCIPWWLGPAGYVLLAGLGTCCIPLIYPPARWYMVLVAFLLGPPVALANGFGVGLTDVDNSANYATLAMFLFAAWAAAAGAVTSGPSSSSGSGIVAGCVLSGVLMVFSVSAGVLLQDLRTGYVTRTPPSSLLTAQVGGALLGVLLSPLAFTLFWSTGQVGLPDGPYPTPWASVTRGMASIGVLGFWALPRYCGVLSGAFFAAAFLTSAIREALPARAAGFVPSPMGVAFPFFIPASTALDFWLGSVIVMVWEWRAPASAAAYAPLAGAGLLVGDGLWAIPSALLAVANVAPPMCMKFA